MKPFNKVKKAASYLTVFLFVFSTVVTAQTAQVFANAVPKANGIEIPAQLGTVEKTFHGQSQFPLIYIQDAHSSLEAQESISKLITTLVKKKGIQTVFTEGYEGEIPLDQLYPFTNVEVKEKVSRHAMDYLRLSGAQYAYVNRTQDFKIVGIDGMKEYWENLKAYENAAKNRTAVAEDLKAITKELKGLGDRLYPKEIKEWLKLKDRLDSRKISMADYLSRFMKMSDLKLETAFPNLAQMNSHEFFDKLSGYEKSFVERYLTDESAREVLKYQRGMALFSRLNLISITPEEYQQIKSNREDFRTEKLAKFLAEHLKKTIVVKKEWETTIESAIRFYETARKRDAIFQKNLKITGPSILVTGGFHKDAMLAFLEVNNISYVLVAPRITQDDASHQARYDFLMSGKFYDDEKPFLNLMPALSAAQQETLPVLELRGVDVAGMNAAAAEKMGAVISIEELLRARLKANERQLAIATSDLDEMTTKAASLGEYTPDELVRGAMYFKGELTTTPLAKKFRPSRANDVTAIDTITDEAERRGLMTLALKSIINGEGVISTLAAGASSRMNVKEAPKEVRDMVAGRDILSKAGVPIGMKDGQVYTFLGAFLKNIARLQDQISKKVGQRIAPTVLILSNDEYRRELDVELAENHNYGVDPSQLLIFHQQLGNQFVATPADVKKLFEGGKIDEARFIQAKALSESAQVELAQGKQAAVMLPNEKTPLGHGEFLHQLVSSGTLLKLILNGNKWISVRNIDNSAATFDENWLLTLGLFLKKGLDMQPEVTPRIKGQKGGALVVTEDGNHQLAEDPQIAVSGANNTAANETSYWFNDAVAIFSLNYVMDIYKQPGQTNQEFVNELKSSSPEELEVIAARGRKKFPSLLDPKPAKNSPAIATKVETNMWQSTGVVSPAVKVEAVGVKGVFNVKDAFDQAATEQKKFEVAKQNRFLGTKQWTGPAESYESNKPYIDFILKHVTEDRLFPEDLDVAVASSRAKQHEKIFMRERVEADLETLKTKPALLVISQEEWSNFG
ncbi:MAG: UTP--glucose-1-phosphate uridylyltransferase, partial [Candidatus Omnitrophica bacterium]|nr:UTP--glucose-1-phosphate uridylyltransferase [Candidatus Omnitrophota bacterium]